jgi:hypothetical protein
MKPILLKLAACILLMVSMSITSCKKNDPVISPSTFIANAGINQIITLPTDSVTLNGSASTGAISSYQWTKISGPVSFLIQNPTAVKTVVKNLVQGVYQFELKVTDAGGLFSKDTVNVSLRTTIGSINVSACNATMVPFSHLSRPTSVATAITAGGKIFFGTYSNGIFLTEIYDTLTKMWSTSNDFFGDINIGNKLINANYLYPVNTETFEVYDATTNSRIIHNVSGARAYIKHTVTDNKAIFAGGFNPDSINISVSKRVDIYDNATNSWSMINFDGARDGMSMMGFGNKIFFAGGTVVRYDSLFLSCDDDGSNCAYYPTRVGSKRIDVYDLTGNTWSTMESITPRMNPITAVVGNKILFAAGGVNSIDIYDASNNSWSVVQVSPETFRGRAHTVGNKVLFPGLQAVGIYDAAANSWSSVKMSEPNIQSHYWASVAGNKILFFLVFDWENNSRNIDIYDASTNSWCHGVLDRGTLGTGIITVGDRIYMAGGYVRSNPNGVYDTNLDDVWIFNF